MKTTTVSLIFSLLFLLSVPAKAISLEWEQTEITLDMGPDQAVITANFPVTNRGSETVRIDRIKTSCGCTGSVINRRVLEPGESTEIVGNFRKGKRTGTNRNRLEVYVDGETDPVAALTMTVNIPTLIEVEPRIVYWTRTSDREPKEVRVMLDQRYLDTITKIEYEENTVNIVESEGTSDLGAPFRLLTISPVRTKGDFRGHITIHGKGPNGRVAETKIHTFIQN